MKEIRKFELDADVTEIECEAHDAAIDVKVADGGKLCVLMPVAKNLNAAMGDGALIVSQKKRRLFCARQSVCICVPPHTVPSLKFTGKHLELTIEDGIYGALSVNAESGDVTLSGCAFESAELLGGDMDAKVLNCTVKGTIYVKIENGNVLSDNTFACRSECRLTKGNIGLINKKCKECVTETGKGNVNIQICGDERDFNCSVYAKGGADEKREIVNPDALYSISAYSGEGNVSLDFIKDESLADDGAELGLKDGISPDGQAESCGEDEKETE